MASQAVTCGLTARSVAARVSNATRSATRSAPPAAALRRVDRQRPPGDRLRPDPDPRERGRREVLQLHGAGLSRRGRAQHAARERRPRRDDRSRSHRRGPVAHPGDDDIGTGVGPQHVRHDAVEALHGRVPCRAVLGQHPGVDDDHRAREGGRDVDGVVPCHRPEPGRPRDGRARPDRLDAGAGCRRGLPQRAGVRPVRVPSRRGEVLRPPGHRPVDDRQRLTARPRQVRGATTGRQGEPAVDRARPAAHRPHRERPDGTLVDDAPPAPPGRHGRGPTRRGPEPPRRRVAASRPPRAPSRRHPSPTPRRSAPHGARHPGARHPEQPQHETGDSDADRPHAPTSSCRAMTTRAAVHDTGATAAGRPSWSTFSGNDPASVRWSPSQPRSDSARDR